MKVNVTGILSNNNARISQSSVARGDISVLNCIASPGISVLGLFNKIVENTCNSNKISPPTGHFYAQAVNVYQTTSPPSTNPNDHLEITMQASTTDEANRIYVSIAILVDEKSDVALSAEIVKPGTETPHHIQLNALGKHGSNFKTVLEWPEGESKPAFLISYIVEMKINGNPGYLARSSLNLISRAHMYSKIIPKNIESTSELNALFSGGTASLGIPLINIFAIGNRLIPTEELSEHIRKILGFADPITLNPQPNNGKTNDFELNTNNDVNNDVPERLAFAQTRYLLCGVAKPVVFSTPFEQNFANTAMFTTGNLRILVNSAGVVYISNKNRDTNFQHNIILTINTSSEINEEDKVLCFYIISQIFLMGKNVPTNFLYNLKSFDTRSILAEAPERLKNTTFTDPIKSEIKKQLLSELSSAPTEHIATDSPSINNWIFRSSEQKKLIDSLIATMGSDLPKDYQEKFQSKLLPSKLKQVKSIKDLVDYINKVIMVMYLEMQFPLFYDTYESLEVGNKWGLLVLTNKNCYNPITGELNIEETLRLLGANDEILPIPRELTRSASQGIEALCRAPTIKQPFMFILTNTGTLTLRHSTPSGPLSNLSPTADVLNKKYNIKPIELEKFINDVNKDNSIESISYHENSNSIPFLLVIFNNSLSANVFIKLCHELLSKKFSESISTSELNEAITIHDIYIQGNIKHAVQFQKNALTLLLLHFNPKLADDEFLKWKNQITVSEPHYNSDYFNKCFSLKIGSTLIEKGNKELIIYLPFTRSNKFIEEMKNALSSRGKTYNEDGFSLSKQNILVDKISIKGQAFIEIMYIIFDYGYELLLNSKDEINFELSEQFLNKFIKLISDEILLKSLSTCILKYYDQKNCDSIHGDLAILFYSALEEKISNSNSLSLSDLIKWIKRGFVTEFLNNQSGDIFYDGIINTINDNPLSYLEVEKYFFNEIILAFARHHKMQEKINYLEHSGGGIKNKISLAFTRHREMQEEKINLENSRGGIKNHEEKSKLLNNQGIGFVDNHKTHYLGKAKGNGDCFFDALAQAINAIQGADKTAKELREICHEFYSTHKDITDKINKKDNRGANDGDYDHIQFSAEECDKSSGRKPAIWGRPYIEGAIICNALKLTQLLIIELIADPEDNKNTIFNYYIVQLNRSDHKNNPWIGESITINLKKANEIIMKGNTPVLVVDQESLHFVPLLQETPRQSLSIFQPPSAATIGQRSESNLLPKKTL